MGELHYFGGPVDLDGDGRPEVMAQLVGPMACGTGGCPSYVLRADAAGHWIVLARLSVTQPPIAVASTRSHGWLDLLVSVRGGGGRVGVARLRHDGHGYPSNPTVAPAEPMDAMPVDARIVVSRYENMRDGLRLP